MAETYTDLDQPAINTIHMLSIDAVQRANSGHPDASIARTGGLNWNVALETGGWLVSDEISVDIEVELVKQLEQAEQEGESPHHA